jgi:hypothetical protein
LTTLQKEKKTLCCRKVIPESPKNKKNEEKKTKKLLNPLCNFLKIIPK